MSGVMKELKKNKVLFLMLIPAVTYVLIFSYFPMSGLLLAFKNYNYSDGIFGSPWVGLENFRFFFLSGQAWKITLNTVMYNVIFIGVGTLFDITAAIFISEIAGKFFKTISQSLMFLPFFMSWVVVAAIVYNIFNYEFGLLNNILDYFGKEPIDVYAMPDVWFFILPLFHIWKSVGYNSIIYLATISGMSPEIKEAAAIDGANIFQRIRYVVLPQLKPTVVILTLLAVGRILRGNFEMFYQLVGRAANLYDRTDIIDTFVFRSMISGTDFSMVAAAAFYQSILCFLIIITVNWIIKKIEREYSLF